jgi:hypothetical protein
VDNAGWTNAERKEVAKFLLTDVKAKSRLQFCKRQTSYGRNSPTIIAGLFEIDAFCID